jgi:hypothetical protein
MTGHRLGLPFQLHRADTLQFVVSSSNAGLFIPHFAGVGSSWRIAMKRGSVRALNGGTRRLVRFVVEF